MADSHTKMLRRYTEEYLPLHNDLSYLRTPAALQCFSCTVNDANGGESTYSDGFAAALDLEQSVYRLLSEHQLEYE